jgi:TRAP-type C4-dicarboxylate transport system permease small subunit
LYSEGFDEPQRREAEGETMARIERWLNWLCNLLNAGANCTLFFMIFIPSFDVLLRIVFSKGILGAEELVSLMQVIIVFFALAYTAAQKGHIGVDLIYDRLPKRVQPLIHSAISFICMVLCLLTAWQTFRHGKEIWGSSLTTVVLKIPIFPFEFLTALGFLLTGLIFLIDFMKSSILVSRFRGGER